ncbi:MAG: hypothetical protein R6V01_09255 [Thermoplasmatota archaeon]
MNDKVFSDTGPLIHLSEIEAVEALDIFDIINVPTPVVRELRKRDLPGSNIMIQEKFMGISTTDEDRILSQTLTREHSMSLNDSLILASAVNGKTELILTDDLEIREISMGYNIKPVGTIGILLRAFREGIISLEELLTKVQSIQDVSSLFITEDLVDEVIGSAKGFDKK